MTALETTPIEDYLIGSKKIYVKRDDLFGVYPSPPLGKLRGLQKVITKVISEGYKIIGCWDTRVSKLGQGVAAICHRQDGVESIISYPKKKGEPIPNAIDIAESLGATIYPIRGNHVGICYAQVRKFVEGKGGYMLPFGLECAESVDSITSEFKTIPSALYNNGTIVLSVGSGVTLAGILNGLTDFQGKVIGISSGRSELKILSCLRKYCHSVPPFLELIPPIMPYYESSKVNCPFPCHPNYDLKAWEYLIRNMNSLSGPYLFWNVGA